MEIMCAGFSRSALDCVEFTLELTDTGWGRIWNRSGRSGSATATSASWTT